MDAPRHLEEALPILTTPADLAPIFDLPLVGLGEVRVIGGFRTRQLAWHYTSRAGFPEPAGTISGQRVWWASEVVSWLADTRTLPPVSRRAWRTAQERHRRRAAASLRHASGGALADV